jgi:phosphonate transport system permease protein
MAVDRAANSPYKLPPPLFSARCKACWFALAVLALVVASFVSLDMQWGAFLSRDAMSSMGRFVGESRTSTCSGPEAIPKEIPSSTAST